MTVNIAGAVTHYDEFIKKLPILNIKNKNINFTVYEGANLCRWNGGRVNRDVTLTPEMADRYNKLGIHISLTFTNSEIDITDTVGNQLLDLISSTGKKYNMNNKVVLVNDNLRKHIRTNYPDIEIIYSITGHPSDVTITPALIDRYKDLETKFDIIVPKFEVVFEPEFYNNVDVSKYELLINDNCKYGCPYYHEHFKEIAKQNTISDNPWKELGHDHCFKIEECWLPNYNPWIGSKSDINKHGEKLGMNYTRDMIKKVIKLGFKSFKLSGRENPTHVIMEEIETFCKNINERSM